MNHQLWTAVGIRVLALTFVMAGAAACGEKLSNTTSRGPTSNQPSSSAVVIGQAPAEPTPPAAATADTAQVTPPAGAQGMPPAYESTKRPMEGDNHSYSTTAPITPQKAEGASATNMEGRSRQ